MTLVLFIIGMLMSYAMTACLYRKIDVAKMLIVGSSIYFCVYIAISGILIWINHFNIIRTELLVICTAVLVSVIVFLKNNRYLPVITFNCKEYIPLAILLVICAFLSGQAQAGFFNTDQDEGLYQIRAMYYMGGYYDDYIDFDEYYELDDAYEKQLYIKELDSMAGYYRLAITDEAAPDSAIGVTHGIATFPALLALFGKMFGLSAMNSVMIVSFLLLIANVYLICGNMKFKIFTKAVAAFVMGFCPIVVWSSKNVLTEITISVFVSLFFVFVTENAKKGFGILAALPIAAMGFMHITTTVFIPLVILVLFLSYIYTKKYHYLYGIIASLLSYGAGFTMAMVRSKRYLHGNMSAIYGMTKQAVNESNVMQVIWTLIIGISVFMLVIRFTPLAKRMYRGFKKIRESSKGTKIAGFILLVLMLAEISFFVYKTIKAYRQGVWIMKMSIFCYVFCTAFFIVPCAVLGIILLRRNIIRDRLRCVITFSFMYVTFLYCGLVWILTRSYFYYARYNTPFIFLAIVAGAILLDYFSYRIITPIMAVCMFFTIKESSILYTKPDNTYCSYDNIASYASCISENDMVIILDQDMAFASVFALPINALTGADIYYATPAILDRIIETYGPAYDDVYIAMYDSGRLTEEDGTYRYVYRSKMKTSVYDTYVDSGMPYAKETIEFESPLALMLYLGN